MKKMFEKPPEDSRVRRGGSSSIEGELIQAATGGGHGN